MAKAGKRLTRKEKVMLLQNGKHPNDWLRERETAEYIQFIHRHSDKTLIKIWKG